MDQADDRTDRGERASLLHRAVPDAPPSRRMVIDLVRADSVRLAEGRRDLSGSGV